MKTALVFIRDTYWRYFCCMVGCRDGVTSVGSVSKHPLLIASQAPVFCTCHVALDLDTLQMFIE